MTRILSIALVLLIGWAMASAQTIEIVPGKPTLPPGESKAVPSTPTKDKDGKLLFSGRKLAEWIGDLKDSDVLIREEAIEVLAQVGSPAKAASAELKKLLKDDNRNLRIRAALALWKIAGNFKEVVAVLTEGMKEASLATRREALVALGSIGPDAAQAAPVIIDCLDDPDYSLRTQAAQTLQRLGKAAMPALLKGLESKNATVRQNVLLHIGSYMTASLDKDHIPALTARLKDDTLRTRVEAGRLLWGLEQIGPPIIAVLLEGVQSSDATLQSLVLQTLSTSPNKPKSILPILEVGLKSPNVYTKVQAARVLFELEKKSDRVLPLYLDILRDNSNRNNWNYAITALNDLKADARPALPRIIEILKLRDYYAPYDVRSILTNIGTPSIAPLIDILKDSTYPAYSSSQETAVGALGTLGQPAAKAILPHLNNADFNVRLRCVRILSALGGDAKDAIPKLIDLFRDANQTVRDTAIQAIGNMGLAAKNAAPKLIELARGTDITLQVASLRTLALIGPDARVVGPLCLPLLKDPTPSVRQAALDLLVTVSPTHKEILPAALQMLKDPAQRETALGVIGRLGPNAARAVPAVAALLKDPSDVTRRSAASALGQIGPAASSAAPVLLEQLAKTDPSLLYATAYALQQIKPDPKVVVPRILDFLKTSRDNSTSTLVLLIGEYGDKAADAFPVLLTLVKDTSRPNYLRGNAALALSQVDRARLKKEAMPEVRKLLALSDIKLTAAKALFTADDTDKDAIAAFEEALKNPNSYSRANACQILAQVGTSAKMFLPAIRALLKDAQYYTRASAAYAAYRVTKDPKEALPTLEALLKDKTQQYTKGYAAYNLGEMGLSARHLLPALQALRSDRENYTRSCAELAVKKIEKAIEESKPRPKNPDPEVKPDPDENP